MKLSIKVWLFALLTDAPERGFGFLHQLFPMTQACAEDQLPTSKSARIIDCFRSQYQE
jgi:hypothetical protein